MQLTLTKPELEAYLKDQVAAGNYPSPEAVIEDALLRAMAEDASLTDEDVESIAASAEQLDRGEGIAADVVAAELRQRYRAKP
jgi:hypothetical protein